MSPHPNRPRPNRPDSMGQVPGRNPKPPEVQQLRTAMGYTQLEFSRLLYVSITTVQAWESGDRRMPPILWEYANLLAEYPEVDRARQKWLRRPVGERSSAENLHKPVIPQQ